MTARVSDAGHGMALFHRVLVGSVAFFVALLIGVQITRAAGLLPPPGS